MKNLFLLFLLSCGGGNLVNVPDIGTPDQDGYVSISQSRLCVGNEPSCGQLNAFYRAAEFFSPISLAYASLSPSVSISYTSAISGTMTLASFPPVNETDPAQPVFGTVGLTAFDSNDLRKCGPGLNQRCTQAIVRAFVSSRSVNFVNDGAIVRIDGAEILDGVNNSTTLITGNIGNRNRIRNSPAGQNPFGGAQTDLGELTLDLNNANFGSYSATIVIELAIGPI